MELPSGKPRVMVDANVLFSAILWPRWPYEVIQHAIKGDFQLALPPVVIDQVRARLQERFPTEVQHFDDFLQRLPYEAIPDPSPALVTRNRDLVRDVTDVPIALAAIKAKVDYLVSEDKDLTARDETTAKLRKRLKVLLSGTFLREVMGWTSEQLEQVRGRSWRDLEAAEEITE